MKLDRFGVYGEFVIKLVLFTARRVLHDTRHYFREGDCVTTPYPTVFLSNHVSEMDIPVLSEVHHKIEDRVRYIIPVREDMLQKHFLVKEFRPKGILKFILGWIDRFALVPKLLEVVGAVGIKRPFRDNIRDLVKSGSHREAIDTDWEILSKKIKAGRNLFLFPEGTYTDDGFVRSVRNGVSYLVEKIEGLTFYNFTFTYDFLFHKKPTVHVGYGGQFQIAKQSPKEKIAQELKSKIADNFVITPGNFFSYILYSPSLFKGMEESQFVAKVKTTIEKLESQGAYIAKELLSENNVHELKRLFLEAQKKGICELQNSYLKTKETLKDLADEKSKKLRKLNPYLYHKNQLRNYESILDPIWSN